MTTVGKWDRWYGMVTDPEPYALTVTYELGRDWLAPCATIEDWGCGKGWLKTMVAPERYRGIDGSHSPFADEIVDLATYTSQTPGLFMRHVLEHDYRWEQILTNALESFTRRMALILFTPLEDEQREIEFEDDPGVPTLALSRPTLEALFKAHCRTWSIAEIETPAKYGRETICRLTL